MRNALSFISLFFGLITFSHGACPPGSFSGVLAPDCFLYVDTPTTVQEASGFCEKQGGNLASIHDASTNSLIGTQVAKNTNFSTFWLGGFTMNTCEIIDCSNKWFWRDLSKFDFQVFPPGNNGSEDGQFTVYNISDSLWYAAYDVDNNANHIKLPFLCKIISPSFTTPIPVHAPCPNGSFAGLQKNECFQYHNLQISWIYASDACRGSGGQLASIHDVFTNVLINNHIMSNTNNQPQITWIGGQAGYNCSQKGGCNYYWEWSDNSTFDYTNFAKDNNYPANGYNVAINSGSSQWYSPGQNEQHAFVCRIPPLS